jgi:hypothetical protein
VSELQVTRWREIPSFLSVRDGDAVVKVQLPPRFQEAIDEAAMRLDAVDSDAYMEGWTRDPWTSVAGSPSTAAESAAAELEARWTVEALAALLDSYGPRP